MNEIKQSLKGVLDNLKGLLKKIFATNPVLYIFLILLINYLFKLVSISEGLTNVVVGLMIVIMSVIIYSKGTSYAETTLSLILALIALFSLSWQKNYHAVIFGILFFIYTLIIIAIKSIKLSMELETILTRAAFNYNKSPNNNNDKQYDEIYIQLNEIVKGDKDNNYITLIDKAKIVRYLSIRNYPMEYLRKAFKFIELIKVVFEISLEDSIKIYSYLYETIILTYDDFKEETLMSVLDLITVIPLNLKDIVFLIDEFKEDIISKEIDINFLLANVNILARKGYSKEDIISQM